MNSLILSTINQGLIFSIAALGVYISFRILNFPDLTVDGSFTLGASVCAILITQGYNPILALLISTCAGIIAGVITGLLHVKLNITNILSGIIVMISLYSINIRIMGRSNLPLFNHMHLFTNKNNLEKILIILFSALIVKLILDIFFKTNKGYLLKALGENPKFIEQLGFNSSKYKILGLAIANGSVGLSGAMFSMYQGFSDISMGTGLIVTALASIVLGEIIFKKLSFMRTTTIVVLGSIFYRTILSAALKMGLGASDLKLITGIIMVIILSTSTIENKIFRKSRKNHKIKSLTFLKRGNVNVEYTES